MSNLSDISHLFLSSVRDAQTGNAVRPVRTPPQRSTAADVSVDLTPEEVAGVIGETHSLPHVGPIRAVLASHLGASQLSRVQKYVAQRCVDGRRVGLIVVDASECRLSVFEHDAIAGEHPTAESQLLDARQMAEALDELAWDVDEWILFLPTPRAPEARALLREISNWTVLAAADNDGLVACYRTLKGLADLTRPKLSLAIEVTDAPQADQIFNRLASVCEQFLGWSFDRENLIADASATEHIAMWACATKDKAQLAAAPQWQVISDFIRRAARQPLAALRCPPSAPVAETQTTSPAPIPTNLDSEVFELSQSDSSAAAIVSAVLHGANQFVECPIKPPHCAQATLAVSRDHRLTLLAVAENGLSHLQEIGRAYQWLIENRALISMAMPQFSIDAHALPQLKLLVDHADLSATILQPILASPGITVQTYRKLRWGPKAGLLLEAA